MMKPLKLSGKNIKVLVNDDLTLTVSGGDGARLWQSSKTHPPTVVLRDGDGEGKSVPLASAGDVAISDFAEGSYRGRAIRLGRVGGADTALELIIAIDAAADELMVQVAEVSGSARVLSVEHLYRWEKGVAEGGCMVIPHGSGYLIPAEQRGELPAEGHQGGIVGARWSLPVFGMFRGEDGVCFIVETWWDADVHAQHAEGKFSALDFCWAASLGELAYPRRMTIKFARGMDYVAMAKYYREHARKQGLLQTLGEKTEHTPVIRRYIRNILFRWPAYNTEDGPAALEDIRRLQEMGFGINFFFPKWSAEGYSPERNTPTTAHSNWQAFLNDSPVPGGWETLVNLERKAHELGCLVQGFVGPRYQFAGGKDYDEDRWPRSADGQAIEDLSVHDASHRIKRVLDGLEAHGLKLDVLYFDGYAAHQALPQDFSPSHRVTRRQTFEAQNDCLGETRRRGIMPGSELARFWCMANCDYFFFTDWSSDRLSNTPVRYAPAPFGEPVPIFQLVFHDCYVAGFSGGGYALYADGYDWWADRTPRLYELLFASAPAYNWLPDPYVPVREWETPKAKARWSWLKRWAAFYQAIATSEMVSHRFLSQDRKQQRVEFANGVAAEFDMAGNRFRVFGVPGFSGEWEQPDEL